MIKKRILSSCLASAILISVLAGCTSSKPDDETSIDGSGTSTIPSKISFWGDKFTNPEASNALMESWENASGIDIELNSFVDTASFQAASSQAIDTDAAPDIMTWWSGDQLESLAKSGKIQPVDDVWDKIIPMGIPADIKDAFTYDGKAYAVPYSLLNNVVFYNKNVFEEAGIENIPTTFDEFTEACDKILAIGITPIGLKNDGWASFIWFQALVGSKNPQLYIDICNGTKDYTDPEMIELMDIWKGMIDKGYFADPVHHSDSNKELALGTTAFMIEPQTLSVTLEKDYGVVSGDDFDVFVLPSMNPDNKGVIFFETTPMVITTKAKNTEAAKKAYTDYYSLEVQKVIAEEMGHAILAEATKDDVVINNVANLASGGEYQSILRFYENTPPELRDFVITEMGKFMGSQQDGITTLEVIQVKADEIFSK